VDGNCDGAGSGGHFPDGLDEVAIDGLIAEVDRLAVAVPVSAALLDGSAVQRRGRRIERRVLADVVRLLPGMRRGATRPTGGEAA
jgi:hypothetical protein